MRSYFSRREACLAAIGTFLGTLSVERSTPARQRDASDAQIGETQPAAGILEPADRNEFPTYSFDRKGRLISVVAPVDTGAQWSSSF